MRTRISEQQKRIGWISVISYLALCGLVYLLH
jgi:hypothetical protein